MGELHGTYIIFEESCLKKNIMPLVKSKAQNPARVFLTSQPYSASVKVDPRLHRVEDHMVSLLKHTDSLAHFLESG